MSQKKIVHVFSPKRKLLLMITESELFKLLKKAKYCPGHESEWRCDEYKNLHEYIINDSLFNEYLSNPIEVPKNPDFLEKPIEKVVYLPQEMQHNLPPRRYPHLQPQPLQQRPQQYYPHPHPQPQPQRQKRPWQQTQLKHWEMNQVQHFKRPKIFTDLNFIPKKCCRYFFYTEGGCHHPEACTYSHKLHLFRENTLNENDPEKVTKMIIFLQNHLQKHFKISYSTKQILDGEFPETS